MSMTFSSTSEATAATLPAGTTSVIIGGRVYRHVAENPRNGLSFLHPVCGWFSGHQVPETGAPILIAIMGQSGALDTNAPPGGDLSCHDGVVFYDKNPSADPAMDQVPGWQSAGPEDQYWPLRNIAAGNITNSRVYHVAKMLHRITGRLVCIVSYARGGQPLVEMMYQGYGNTGGALGTIWAGFQAEWVLALDAPLPGRGMSLRDYGVTLADYLIIDQGEGDADLFAADDPRASSATEYPERYNILLNQLAAPPGLSSLPVIGSHTHILHNELLDGSFTDSRNAQIRALPFNQKVQRRKQISVISSARLNQIVADPQAVGTFDGIHRTGPATEVLALRTVAAIMRGPVEQPAQTADGSFHVLMQPGGVVTLVRNVSIPPGATLALTFPDTLATANYPVSIVHSQATSSTASADIHVSGYTADGMNLRNASATLTAIVRVTIGPVRVA